MRPRWKRCFYDVIAAEISAMTRHYDRIVQWMRVPGDEGYPLDAIDCPAKEFVEGSVADHPKEKIERTAILLSGTINHHDDIEGLLKELKSKLSRSSRVIIVAFNPYLQWLCWLALKWNLKTGLMPTTLITLTDVDHLCKLAEYERVRLRHAVYCPWRLLGIGSLINAIMPAIPLLRHLSLTSIIVIRLLFPSSDTPPTSSIIVAARNETGNIEPNVEPLLGAGVTNAKIVVLDADLTVLPELGPRFIDAWATGKADFINGSSIVSPMEGEAMGLLNRLGNVFFAKALTWVLGVRLGDSLCANKLLTRADSDRMKAWRNGFGDSSFSSPPRSSVSASSMCRFAIARASTGPRRSAASATVSCS